MRSIGSHLLACVVLVSGTVGASAQWRWGSDGTPERVGPSAPRYQGQRPQGMWNWDAAPGYAMQPLPPYGASSRYAMPGDIRDGGGQPDIAPVAPPVVAFEHAYAPNTIVIDSADRRLYFVLPGKQAYAYQIAVGREGFDWYGSEVISRKQAWPDWHPPAEMRERDPNLPEKMTGGLKNPLGAMALYLGKTLYRIHGTNDERSLGQAGSSGCFRMLNANVLHLASVAELGTTVHVVRALNPDRISRAPRQPAAVEAAAPPAAPVPRAGPPPRTSRDPWSDWDRPPVYRAPRDWRYDDRRYDGYRYDGWR